MQEDNIRDIATATATSTAKDFLKTIPKDVSQTLSTQFLQNLKQELQAELQALIQSRLLWSQQAVQLAQVELQRLQAFKLAAPKPLPTEPVSQRLVPATEPLTKDNSLKGRNVIEAKREQILKQYNLSLEDFQPHDSDARPRRRRKRSTVTL